MPKRVKKRRPTDVNQLAHQLVEESTTEDTDEPAKVTPDELSRVMAMIGRKGGRIGGKRRLETLTQERRSEIALKAAQARWKKARPQTDTMSKQERENTRKTARGS